MCQSYEYYKLKGQLAVLKDVAESYPSSSIGNIIQQIESRIKHIEEKHEKENI